VGSLEIKTRQNRGGRRKKGAPVHFKGDFKEDEKKIKAIEKKRVKRASEGSCARPTAPGAVLASKKNKKRRKGES